MSFFFNDLFTFSMLASHGLFDGQYHAGLHLIVHPGCVLTWARKIEIPSQNMFERDEWWCV